MCLAFVELQVRIELTTFVPRICNPVPYHPAPVTYLSLYTTRSWPDSQSFLCNPARRCNQVRSSRSASKMKVLDLFPLRKRV
jgi:hypothetical protein